MATIEINGQTIEAEDGSMLIAAADEAGIYIPRFCYHDKLSIAANCRMCLVEVENAPKPLPACATPIMDGMKVHTRSELARDAQKSTMEFLLINHPLDCPICDQGGECELQDLAVGYGRDVSQYSEGKRVVMDKNLGPLISTDMTRCIQCTRCVRFGQELAGVMELGMAGRGEHSEIMTFMGHTVDSELSGNVIDLCPVGALTSKPFRYRARAWEMHNHQAIAPHDTVGSNIDIHVMRDTVMRVVPAANEAINEVWLSDRDRFSYEALNSEQRLTQPRLKINGEWKVTDWQTALEHVAGKLKVIIEEFGAESIDALVSPTATLEELHLLNRLMQGLGSHNIDYRLRQQDFTGHQPPPLLGSRIAELEEASSVLLVHSNIRKEQPILGLRLRKAVRNGTRVHAINPVEFDYAFKLASSQSLAPDALLAELAILTQVIASRKGDRVPDAVSRLANDTEASVAIVALANELIEAGDKGHIILGMQAQMDANYAALTAMTGLISSLTGARLGNLAEANSVAAWQVLAAAREQGRNAADMLSEPRKACLLFNIDPAHDTVQGEQAIAALRETGMVVHIGLYHDDELDDCCHVQLPLAAFSETDGTHINCEGIPQSWTAAVSPAGDARPGWKILRVLGNFLALDGFDYNQISDVRSEASAGLAALRQTPADTDFSINEPVAGRLQRIIELPLYRSDGIVRRATPLQHTADSRVVASMHPDTLQSIGAEEGGRVRFSDAGRSIEITVTGDSRVPVNCVLIPTATGDSNALGGAASVEVTH
jgi:NADH-quinone oxidoreductase subunit G